MLLGGLSQVGYDGGSIHLSCAPERTLEMSRYYVCGTYDLDKTVDVHLVVRQREYQSFRYQQVTHPKVD
jgi:hypothetical protein